MKKLRKIIATVLVYITVSAVTLNITYTAYASVAATGVITAGGYVVKILLDACGISLSLSSLTALIGEWDTLQEYEQLGSEGKLGAFSQYLYNKTHTGETGEAIERGQAAEQALADAMSASWGATIENLDPLLKELKDYLGYCYGYGTADSVYYVPSVPENKTWGVTGWSSRDFFPLPTTPAVLVPAVANDASFTLFLTSYVAGYTSNDMNVQNWYYEPACDVFGVYDAAEKKLETYERNASDKTYRTYYCTAYSAYAYEDGSLKYSVTSTDWWKRATIYCSPADAGALPFPVFGSLSAAMDYVETGAKDNVYVPGTLPLEAENENKALQKAVIKSITGTLTIPASADAAQNKLAGISDAYASDTALKSAIADAGLAIDWGAEDTETGDKDKTDTDTLLKRIIDTMVTLPDSVVDAVEGRLETDGETAKDKLSLPVSIMDKFPFCIPFDVIYLVKALAADPVAPKFDIPLKFDYESFHYDEIFIIDFSDYDSVVRIFRIMLDVLFISGLIVVTRNLIRG